MDPDLFKTENILLRTILYKSRSHQDILRSVSVGISHYQKHVEEKPELKKIFVLFDTTWNQYFLTL